MRLIAIGFTVAAGVLYGADPTDPQAQELLDIAKKQVGIVSMPYRIPFTGDGSNQLLAIRLGKSVKGILNKEEAEALSKLIGSRTDVQTGATSSNSGTTSLAMKGAIPKILGFAVENGAIESTAKGTVMTFRATPWGVVKALQGSGYLDILDSLRSSPEASFLKGISLAASFDTSKGVESPTLLANRQQLQSWSVRSELYNNRDAGLREYHQFWGGVATAAADGIAKDQGIIVATLQLTSDLRTWSQLQAWRQSSFDRVEKEIEQKSLTGAAAESAFLKIAAEQLAEFDKLDLPDNVISAVKSYIPAAKANLISRNRIVDYAQRGSLATLDFTVKRDSTLPDLSTLTGIWETHIGKRLVKRKEETLKSLDNLPNRRNHDLTINGALSFFNSPAKLSTGKLYRMRDFKATVQYDIPLGKVEKLGNFILTNAFRYQRLFEDSPIALLASLNPNLANPPMTSGTGATAMAIAKRGNFAIYQTKLTIPAGTGVRIPLSFSVANRSELLAEKRDVNANIGITFDIDALFAKASK
jgi:hypothetical protein